MVRKTSVVAFAILIGSCGAEAPTVDDAILAEQGNQVADASTLSVALSLDAAANGPHRSPENIARNIYRHPVETLTFFGLQPGMTVVEAWPGGGWYSEILAPALGPDGKLVAASYPAEADPEAYRSKNRAKFDTRLKNEPIFANTYHGTLQAPDQVDIGQPGSADLVVTFRNTHNWINNGIAEANFKAFYDVLKPGGILGVVQHRAPEGVDPVESAKTGYVPQAHEIAMATAAGFELVEASEVNANPKDTKDHPEGVWTLPPRLRLGDQDKAKYVAIGESDRMTLKFRKP